MKTHRQAATYLRSSKDRSDVSIDAQRRILAELAERRGLALTREYADVVLSGKDDNRPAFLELRQDLRRRDRTWSVVLLLDPERLARNRHIAYAFEADCELAGVDVVYANLPESNPIVDMMLKPMLHGVAQYFSLQSKMKGRAGMAENVRKGFRAGGRPPMGYRLEHFATSAVREGQPVLKSRLAATEEAPSVATYLKARAAGISRLVAARALPRQLAHTTLIGMEWNALTYAGSTVWNVHNEYRAPRLGQDLQRIAGGYQGGMKRRPRADWVIQTSTHPALITQDEAEILIRNLEASPFKPRRRTSAQALLTGLLRTPEGTPWYSDNGGKHYRLGRKGQGRKLRAAPLDELVVRRVLQDLVSPRFVAAAYAGTMKHYLKRHGKELAELRAQDLELQARTSRFMDMAAQLESSGPVLRKINEVERERAAIATRMEELEAADKRAAALAMVTEEHVGQLLRVMADEISAYDRERLKDWLLAQLEAVELEPAGLHVEICYRLALSAGRGNKVASPRQSDAIPLIHRSRAKVG